MEIELLFLYHHHKLKIGRNLIAPLSKLFRLEHMMNFILNRLRQIVTVSICLMPINLILLPCTLLGGSQCIAAEPDLPNPLEGSPPIKVAASLHPYALLVKEIGGESVVVTTLVGEGLDPHDVEPTPSMLRRGADADLIVLNGAGLDDWARRGAHEKKPLIAEEVAIAHISGDSTSGVSWWLDPDVVVFLAEEISERLCLLRGSSCEIFRARAESLSGALRESVAKSKRADSGEPRHILSFHQVFGRIASRLGYQEIGGFAECETKARTWGMLREARQVIEREGLTVMLVEPFHQKSDDMMQVARELEVTPLSLDSMGWRSENYRVFFSDILAGLRRAGGSL
jgi:zinc/manganese transport system substrate-binding protein